MFASHLPGWGTTDKGLNPVPGAGALPVQTKGITHNGKPLISTFFTMFSTIFSTIFSRMFSYIYYASIISIVIFIILIVVHFTVRPIFSFSPNDFGIIPVPTVSDQQLVFTNSPAASDISANFINVSASTYTIGMDVFLSGNFQASNLPRVLLYRAIGVNVSPPQSDTTNELATRYRDSNILVWLDPMKNDLFVSIISSSSGTGTATTRVLETTPAIENVPVKKVFRVTVVFTPQFIEVYINGNLDKSMTLKNAPSTVSDRAVFYPVISSIGPNVLTSNIAFWPRALTVREARAYGGPISSDAFFSKSAF